MADLTRRSHTTFKYDWDRNLSNNPLISHFLNLYLNYLAKAVLFKWSISLVWSIPETLSLYKQQKISCFFGIPRIWPTIPAFSQLAAMTILLSQPRVKGCLEVPGFYNLCPFNSQPYNAMTNSYLSTLMQSKKIYEPLSHLSWSCYGTDVSSKPVLTKQNFYVFNYPIFWWPNRSHTRGPFTLLLYKQA